LNWNENIDFEHITSTHWSSWSTGGKAKGF